MEALFKLAIPVMLGAILTYLINISSAQTDLVKQMATLNGQVGILASQNSDYSARFSKLDGKVDNLGKVQGENTARILVLENARHFK